MNAGHTYSCCKRYQLNEKQMVLKRQMTIQLYAQTNFHGQVLLRPDVELPRQAKNDLAEQLKITQKMNELFSAAGLASQVLWLPYYGFSVKNVLMNCL